MKDVSPVFMPLSTHFFLSRMHGSQLLFFLFQARNRKQIRQNDEKRNGLTIGGETNYLLWPVG